MITVGRSRKIWLSLVIQSYAQLAKVYDEKSADIIKSNCNIQIFIGTTDQKTIEEFSKKCGNYSIIQRNISFSSSRSEDISSSASIKERPLIYPTELQQLNSANNMGNAIVNVFGFPPLKSKFTPSFKCSKFNLEKTNQLLSAGKYFNEERVFYNMLDRNEIVNPKNKKKKETIDITEYMEALKIDVDKLSPEVFGTAQKRIELLRAIEDNDISKTNTIIDEILEENKESDSEFGKSIIAKLKRRAVSIKNLGVK